jgi:lysophospholipase L1-like esterase
VKHRTFEPLKILFLVAVLLVLSSLFSYNWSIGPFHIRNLPIPFHSIVKVAPDKSQHNSYSSVRSAKASEKQGISASRTNFRDRRDTSEIPYSAIIGPPEALNRFFYSLREMQSTRSKTRIAYFGDSIIEGDIITQDLRHNLQELFGGKGVGFMPITSVAARSRGTINHFFSTNWRSIGLHPKYEGVSELGISGFTYLPQIEASLGPSDNPDAQEFHAHSWVQYEASKLFSNTKQFPVVKLYYGEVSDFTFITYSIDGSNNKIVNLQKSKGPEELLLSNGSPAHKIRIDFFSRAPISVYGTSIEDQTGIYVDNFSIRGYSGLTLQSIPSHILSAFDKYLGYNLIIVHFGLNVTNLNTKKEINWYIKHMIQSVEHLRSAFPEASILIVSINDISESRDGQMVTRSWVPPLVEAQKQVAFKIGAAFWNLYDAMGGENSMVAWAQDTKPLAYKDYTHFNHRGSKKVGDMLTSAILDKYMLFQQEHRKQGSHE